MTNAEIFQKVALREINPQEAADLMIAADKKAAERLRPAWLPPIAWVLCLAIIGIVLAACGVRKD